MGGGIGMGNTCKPMAVLFQCMTKFTTNKKKKKKKRIHVVSFYRISNLFSYMTVYSSTYVCPPKTTSFPESVSSFNTWYHCDSHIAQFLVNKNLFNLALVRFLSLLQPIRL